MGYFAEQAEKLRIELGGYPMPDIGGYVDPIVLQKIVARRAAIEAAMREVASKAAFFGASEANEMGDEDSCQVWASRAMRHLESESALDAEAKEEKT